MNIYIVPTSHHGVLPTDIYNNYMSYLLRPYAKKQVFHSPPSGDTSGDSSDLLFPVGLGLGLAEAVGGCTRPLNAYRGVLCDSLYQKCFLSLLGSRAHSSIISSLSSWTSFADSLDSGDSVSGFSGLWLTISTRESRISPGTYISLVILSLMISLSSSLISGFGSDIISYLKVDAEGADGRKISDL